MRLLLTCLVVLMGCSANAQALWRNFFTTNQNPRVTVVAGSNATVVASTVGVDQRIFTVSSTATGSGQTNWPLSSITNANYLTNWATIDTNYVPPFAGFATNASNATNFWGVLNTTNIPSLNYISNNAGFGTNTTIFGNLNASNEVLTLSGIGTTISPIWWLTNGTAASLGAQQASPALMLGGQGWRSGNSTTMPVQMGMYVLPVQGTSANPLGTLVVVKSITNAAASSSAISFRSDGQIDGTVAIISSRESVGTALTLYPLEVGSSDNTCFRGTTTMNPSTTSGAGFVGALTQTPSAADQRLGYLNFGADTDKLTIGIGAYSDEAWSGSTRSSYLRFDTTPTGSLTRSERMRLNGAGNLTVVGTVTPTNGIVYQGKHAFTTNFTAIESIQLYNCNGTNIVITLPNCTNTTPWKIYRFSQTNSYASFTLTNANGLQTIHNGIDLSYSIRSAKQTAVYHDGAHWWLAVPDQPNFPNAQFSCSTNIPLTLANTAYPVTFNSTDFNNSLGIGLGLGTNGLHSKMWLTNSGVYEFGPSVVQSFNGNDTIRFWFRTFDTNVPASSTPSKGQNGSIRVITVPFIISVTQPTPVEIWAQSDTTGEELPAAAASGNYPAAPSVIVPVKMISHPWP